MITGERLAIGGISGAVAQGTIYPMEVIQTRLAISPVGTYSGILDAFAKIVRQEGYFALFRCVPSLVLLFVLLLVLHLCLWVGAQQAPKGRHQIAVKFGI